METFTDLGINPDEGQKVRVVRTTGLPYGFPEGKNGWRYEGAEGIVAGEERVNEEPVEGYEGEIYRVIYHGQGTSPDSFGVYLTSEIGPTE